jgi:uncharacterized glyoxalase superfamily protein PhnB
MTTFYPSFRYEDAPAAIEWLERAFGFEREMVVEGESEGDVPHAQMRFGDGLIMLGSTRGDEHDAVAGTGWTYVAVEGDIDAKAPPPPLRVRGWRHSDKSAPLAENQAAMLANSAT